ncbi:uncharacterized protein LOC127587069 isoform X1 [Pristis pectinata]|uniref:uncharacterized protein LOC127587069 isoform X1 n=1 Tax=Pristis pectinata TaxID=685728 RepID=UPI00223E6ABD|nr:uncharacterized protein LOC127587069 isoform X1 [Pristis pectinata]
MELRPRPGSGPGSAGGRANSQPRGGGDEEPGDSSLSSSSSSAASSSSEGGGRRLGGGGRRHSRSWADVRSLGGGEAEARPRPGSGGAERPRPGPGAERLRKARSMEGMAVKLARGPAAEAGGGPGGQAARLAEAEERLVRQKVKFSRFLDEISGQVLSPAALSSLGRRPGPEPQAGGRPRAARRDDDEEPGPGPDGGSLAAEAAPEPGKELLTDAHQPKFLREEGKDLQHPLACVTCQMEEMDSEFKSSHGYLEAELYRARVELNDLRGMFSRLQQNYLRTRQANRFMEQKLDRIVANMEAERNGLNQRISDLTSRLARAQKTICALEKMTEQGVEPGYNHPEASLQPPAFPDLGIFSPPAPFVDEGLDCVSASGSEAAGGCSEATGPEDLHRPGPERWANHREAARPVTAKAPPPSCRVAAAAPDLWSPCAEGLDWLDGLQAARGKGPSSPGGLHLPPDDPFGPLLPEADWPAAGWREAASDGRQGSPRPGGSTCDLWDRPEASCQGNARAEGASGRGPGHPSLPCGHARASQRRGLAGQAPQNEPAFPQPPGAERGLSAQAGPGDSEQRARQWVSELEYRLLGGEEEEEGEWRPQREARRQTGGTRSGPAAYSQAECQGMVWARCREPDVREPQASWPKFRGGRD